MLITGESGTGKELVARAIHDRSGRKGPFLAINCAAVPETLLESELFGHARGAFTDAHAARKGLFVEAHGGTLFLDEIGEMAPGMQAKILRALQERKVRPVGGSTESPFDARIITATNRDLEAEVATKRFREDLYYRINVVRVEVPPLRARGNDALQLAQHFLDARRGAQRQTGQRPGQRRGRKATFVRLARQRARARELHRARSRAGRLRRDHAGRSAAKIRDQKLSAVLPVADDPIELPTMQTVEDRYIQRVLEGVGGNKTLAAKILGFDRRTLYRKLASTAAVQQQPERCFGAVLANPN